MSARPMLVAALILVAFSLAACQAVPPTHAGLIRDHLEQLIGVQSIPCGGVYAYSRERRLHYRAECSSGSVYGVYVEPDGHVRVKLIEGASAAASAP